MLSSITHCYRFLKRGIDECGNVANFVEIEQTLEGEHGVASLVQVSILAS